MDYAIVEIGGNQFKVSKGDVITADFTAGQPKKAVKVNKVLMYHHGKKVEIGSPYVKGASVSCEIVKIDRGPKVIAYKYKRRKSCKFKKGHRQQEISLKVKEIDFVG
ncbi:MAG: 50S ribosomal protein L21 [Candidatus Omnitrophica bacterium]|nr:50S ribosomal protein L21 [Candidatus Omnitrophota bacterium]